jgi:hypothetical protein
MIYPWRKTQKMLSLAQNSKPSLNVVNACNINLDKNDVGFRRSFVFIFLFWNFFW